jgi:hypothetical protein
MAKRAKVAFDPMAFLATLNHGRKISLYRKGTWRLIQPGVIPSEARDL